MGIQGRGGVRMHDSHSVKILKNIGVAFNRWRMPQNPLKLQMA